MGSKILVVDDEPFMHRLLQYHLGRAGYQLISARNGREAVDLARSEAPQLVIMDIMMADVDGLTALKRLKQDETTRAIPVIMITANPQAITRQECESAGAAIFLTKPFSPTRLLQEIRRLIPEAANP